MSVFTCANALSVSARFSANVYVCVRARVSVSGVCDGEYTSTYSVRVCDCLPEQTATTDPFVHFQLHTIEAPGRKQEMLVTGRVKEGTDCVIKIYCC